MHDVRLHNVSFVLDAGSSPESHTGDASSLLSAEVLPSLSKLSIVDVGSESSSENTPSLALTALLGQITVLVLENYPSWLPWWFLEEWWGALTSLEYLRTAESAEAVQFALAALPAPLRVLDLSTPESENVSREEDVGALDLAWDQRWASLGQLQEVVMAPRVQWPDDARALRPASWLSQVEVAARAQGAQVRFVEWG